MEEAWELAVVSGNSSGKSGGNNKLDWSSQQVRLRYQSVISAIVALFVIGLDYTVTLPFLSAPPSPPQIHGTYLKAAVIVSAIGFSIAFAVRSFVDFKNIPVFFSGIEKAVRSLNINKQAFSSLEDSMLNKPFLREPLALNVTDPALIAENIHHSAIRLIGDPGQMFGADWVAATAARRKLKKHLAASPGDPFLKELHEIAEKFERVIGSEEAIRSATVEICQNHRHEYFTEFAKLEERIKDLESAKDNYRDFVRSETKLFGDEIGKQRKTLLTEIKSSLKAAKLSSFSWQADRFWLGWVAPQLISVCFIGISIFLACQGTAVINVDATS